MSPFYIVGKLTLNSHLVLYWILVANLHEQLVGFVQAESGEFKMAWNGQPSFSSGLVGIENI